MQVGTNITGDPMLDSDFRLRAGSPAINAGTDMIQIERLVDRMGVTTTEILGTGYLDYITTDWFGSERKSGTVDIGAHEF